MANTKTVKVSEEAHAVLNDLAETNDNTLSAELNRIIEEKRRERMFAQANAAYARLRADEEEWTAYQEEMRELEGTLADGLDDYE